MGKSTQLSWHWSYESQLLVCVWVCTCRHASVYFGILLKRGQTSYAKILGGGGGGQPNINGGESQFAAENHSFWCLKSLRTCRSTLAAMFVNQKLGQSSIRSCPIPLGQYPSSYLRLVDSPSTALLKTIPFITEEASTPEP